MNALTPSKVKLPIVVNEWRHNAAEVFRVTLDEYKGVTTIDVRSWWRDAEGNLRPGKNGLTASIKHLDALKSGLEVALDMAINLGLIDEEPRT